MQFGYNISTDLADKIFGLFRKNGGYLRNPVGSIGMRSKKRK